MVRVIAGIWALTMCSAILWTAAATEPSVPEIPGLTVDDKFPGGCVDCHVNMPDQNLDVRISTLMRRLSEGVDPGLLEKVQGVAPDPTKLKGRHPRLPERTFRDIPAACMTCHGKAVMGAPKMGPLLHVVHLVGGKDNHFLTLFRGECTHCHKLDTMKGTWSVPSGAEK